MSETSCRVIGITGKMGSGKSTAAEYIEKHLGIKRMSFAQGVKDLAREIGWDGIKDEPGRRLLQALGTGARNAIFPNVWIVRLELHWRDEGGFQIVIDDLRFLNEAHWIKEKGGVIIRLKRSLLRNGLEHCHESETEQDRIKADHVFSNDGTLKKLYRYLDGLIESGFDQKQDGKKG